MSPGPLLPAVACAALLGCQSDIRLGTYASPDADNNAAIDAAPPADSAVGSFVNGTYSLAHGQLAAVDCFGTLQGQEASFSGLSAADVGLINGDVNLQVSGNNVIVSGPAIEDAYQTGQLTLQHDVVPEQPPTAVMTVVPVTGPGPNDTVRYIATLGLDEATATETGAEGQSGIVFLDEENSPSEDSCALTFIASTSVP